MHAYSTLLTATIYLEGVTLVQVDGGATLDLRLQTVATAKDIE